MEEEVWSNCGKKGVLRESVGGGCGGGNWAEVVLFSSSRRLLGLPVCWCPCVMQQPRGYSIVAQRAESGKAGEPSAATISSKGAQP